ncbi:MAG: hypothetical protein CMJ16_03555 [Peredibacter sp.]|nr:hypothetical protein [Peredibacter sp.]
MGSNCEQCSSQKIYSIETVACTFSPTNLNTLKNVKTSKPKTSHGQAKFRKMQKYVERNPQIRLMTLDGVFSASKEIRQA